MNNKFKTTLAAFLGGAVLASVAWAAVPAGGLHIFEAGQVIQASQVNENFSTLDNKIQANCDAIKVMAGIDSERVQKILELIDAIGPSDVTNILDRLSDHETRLAALETSSTSTVTSMTVVESTVASHGTRLDSLEHKTQFQSVLGNITFFSGTNLQVNNGMGSTDTTNGLGNLILGYNEETDFAAMFAKPADRTGSHNLVVGRDNQYSSFSGICQGFLNRLDGSNSVVLGCENSVCGTFGSVVGGTNNRVTHRFSAIGGGGGQSSSKCKQWRAGLGNTGGGPTMFHRLGTRGATCQDSCPDSPDGDDDDDDDDE